MASLTKGLPPVAAAAAAAAPRSACLGRGALLPSRALSGAGTSRPPQWHRAPGLLAVCSASGSGREQLVPGGGQGGKTRKATAPVRAPPGWGRDPARDAASPAGLTSEREADLREVSGSALGNRDAFFSAGLASMDDLASMEDVPKGSSIRLPVLPERWLVVAGISAAFVLCNMDKVNMSVAVLPLANEFGWSNSDRGLVSSAFFWGYALTQVPGGYMASSIGGRRVLLTAVFVWSLGTMLAPFAAAHGVEALCASRFLVGLGEGGAPAAATAIMARAVPAGERARAVTIAFGGMDMGSVAGLLVAPFLIESFGWESCFYTFAVVGFAWCIGWASLGGDDRDVAGEGTAAGVQEGEGQQVERAGEEKKPRGAVPWGEFAKSRPVWGVSALHFSANWGYYTLLAWLPSFFQQGLGQSLEASSRLTMMPYLFMLLATPVVGPWADGLAERGASVTRVRKLATAVHMLGPAACMLGLSGVMSGALGDPQEHTAACLALLCGSFAMWPFGRAGLYCNAQDLSRRHAGVLLGISNTAGAISGVIGVWAAGHVLEATGGSWAAAVFGPCALFNAVGFAAFAVLGSGESQGWDKEPKERSAGSS